MTTRVEKLLELTPEQQVEEERKRKRREQTDRMIRRREEYRAGLRERLDKAVESWTLPMSAYEKIVNDAESAQREFEARVARIDLVSDFIYNTIPNTTTAALEHCKKRLEATAIFGERAGEVTPPDLAVDDPEQWDIPEIEPEPEPEVSKHEYLSDEEDSLVDAFRNLEPAQREAALGSFKAHATGNVLVRDIEPGEDYVAGEPEAGVQVDVPAEPEGVTP